MEISDIITTPGSDLYPVALPGKTPVKFAQKQLPSGSWLTTFYVGRWSVTECEKLNARLEKIFWSDVMPTKVVVAPCSSTSTTHPVYVEIESENCYSKEFMLDTLIFLLICALM